MKNTKNEVTYKMAIVPVQGEVGASGNVVPFVARNEMIPVAIPTKTRESDIQCVIVSGPSLTELGVDDGDILIFTTRFTQREVMFESVCIVYVHSTAELVAKKICFERGGNIRLKASGGNVRDLILPIEDIEIRGKVIAVQKRLR